MSDEAERALEEATDECSRCHVGEDAAREGDCAVCSSASNRLIRELDHQRRWAARTGRQLHETILLLGDKKVVPIVEMNRRLDLAVLIVEGSGRLDLAKRVRDLKENV